MSAIAAVTARINAIESRFAAHRRLAMAEAPRVDAPSAAALSIGTGEVAGLGSGPGSGMGTVSGAAPVGAGTGNLYDAVAQQTEAALSMGLLFDPTARASYAPGASAAMGGVSGVGGVSSIGWGPTTSPVDPATQVRADVPYASLFNAAGARYGIPPAVLAGMGYVESRFQLHVVSSAGAQGMMQFLPGTAASMGVDPWDPASAVDGAARYIRNALDRFGGSLEMAVGAYNIGPGAMARAGAVLPGSQAEKYVNAVMQAAGRMS